MSLLSKIKDAANKVKEAAEDALNGVAGAVGSRLGGASNNYGSAFDIVININDKEITNDTSIITGVMVDSGMSPEAGVCEIHMELPGYEFLKGDEISIDGDFAQFKIGQPLEIKMASKFASGRAKNSSTVFKGFVERIECEINNVGNVHFVLHGMDAKMWMMANKLTESRGTGKSLEQIMKSVINNYRSQAKIGKISLLKNITIKSTFYQVNQSDYEFLCMLADLTGSLFYVGSDGKINFCAPSKIGRPVNKIQFKDEIVEGIRFSASVWGTPQSVKVTAIDLLNPSKTISATSGSVASIGSGKASKQVVPQNYSAQRDGVRYVYITDNSIESKDQAQARADAEYNRRNIRFVEMELMTQGNPKLDVGQGVELDGFGAPFNNEYLVVRVIHSWGTLSEDGMYHTKSCLVANKFKPQKG